MKKVYLLLFLLFIMMCTYNLKTCAATDTGHADYAEIYFPYGSKDKLLKDYSQTDKDQALKSLKKSFVGWKTKNLCNPVYVEYVGKTIFAKYNNTNQDIEFNYVSKIENTEESSIVTEGSIGGSLTGKGKNLSAGLEAEIKRKVGNVSTIKITEQSEFDVIIKPNRKVSLIIKGDAKISNGVAKYYFLGICFKKGSWEIINVLSEYYELCEEYIK